MKTAPPRPHGRSQAARWAAVLPLTAALVACESSASDADQAPANTAPGASAGAGGLSTTAGQAGSQASSAAGGGSGGAAQGGAASGGGGASAGEGGAPSGQGGVGGASGGASGGAGGNPDNPDPPSSDICQRLVAGPGGTSSPAVSMSAAHAAVRFFGIEPSPVKVDASLVAALSGEQPFSLASLDAYAKALPGVCALPAAGPLGPAKVTLQGSTALVVPGTGDLSLPVGAAAVVVDLRGLPEDPALPAALERAVGLALASPVSRNKVRVRQHKGLRDEVIAPAMGFENIYASAVVALKQPSIPAAAATDLPLVLLTGPRLAPAAAEIAATLRHASLAWMLGEDVPRAVAESRWLGVGDAGLMVRDRAIASSKLLADVEPADRRTTQPELHIDEVLGQMTPPVSPQGESSRADIEPATVDYLIEEQPPGLPQASAALIAAHGAARLFFPCFDVVGDTIDQTLDEQLAALGSAQITEAKPMLSALRRLSAQLHDSHSWVSYYPASPAAPRKSLPVALDFTEQGVVVVRRSVTSSILPGDVVLAVDQRPVAELLAEIEPLISASTEGALRRDLLSVVLYAQPGATLTLRGEDGVERLATVPADQLLAERLAVSSRQAGPLSDLGAPDIYYVNLDGPVFTPDLSAAALIEAAAQAKALVIDGRGYPGTTETWAFIKRIIKTKSDVLLDVPVVSPLGGSFDPQPQSWAPAGAPRFDGPVVVLIGPTSQSQAEHILIPMVNEHRATFVGRRTAGANGNITGLMVPGRMSMTFTGMRVRFGDGSTFHGQGIAPDLEVWPTQAALAAGLDPELDAAIKALQ